MSSNKDRTDNTFVEGWIRLLHRTATGTRSVRTLLTPVGIAIFGLFVALFVAAAKVTDEAFRLPPLLDAGVAIVISIPFLAIGLALTGWSAIHFLRVRGTPVPFNPPPKVVASGPYRYVRNPMLLGVFVFLFGLGIVLASISMVFLFTPLFILSNVWEIKHIEEPELVRRLGEQYLEYRRRTPMFFPRHPAGSKR